MSLGRSAAPTANIGEKTAKTRGKDRFGPEYESKYCKYLQPTSARNKKNNAKNEPAERTPEPQ